VARVPGPSLTDLADLGDRYADIVTEAGRAVLTQATRRLQVPASADDVAWIRTRWQAYVDDALLPALAESLWHGVNVVHRSLAEHVTALTAAATPQPDDLPDLVAEVTGPDAPADLPPLADAIPRVTNPAAETYLATRRNALVGIGDDLWGHARTALLTGMQAGEGVSTLRQRVLGSLEVSAPRAQAIARTEVNGAANVGSIMQMRATGLPATKEWLATPGPRTRKDHARANGQVVDLDAKFNVGGHMLDGPHDQLGPASEVVNCRCTLVYDVGGDDLQKLVEPTETLVPAATSSLTPAQEAILHPDAKRTEAAIRKELGSTPAGKNVLDQIKRFTETRGGVTTMRKQVASYLNGETLSPAVRQRVEDFVNAVNSYPTEQVPQLFRGFGIKPDPLVDINTWFNNFEARYAAGQRMDLNMSSFTSSERKAEGFMRSPNGTSFPKGTVHVKIVVDGDIHALPVERLNKFAPEKEWIAGGQFEVTALEPPAGKRTWYVIHVRQLNVLRRGG
jgi:hypothetical protein